MAVASLTLRVLLLAVLAWSAATKLRPAGFRAVAGMMRELGIGGHPALAGAALIGAELATAVLLAVPATASLATVAAVVVFAGLTGGVAVVLSRRMTVRCACFGAQATPLRPIHLVRNGFLLTCAVAAVATGSAGPLDGSGWILGASAGAVLAVVTVRLEDLAFLFSPLKTWS